MATTVDLVGRSAADEPAPTYQPPDNYRPGTTSTGRPGKTPAGPSPPEQAGNDPDPPSQPSEPTAGSEPGTLFGDDP